VQAGLGDACARWAVRAGRGRAVTYRRWQVAVLPARSANPRGPDDRRLTADRIDEGSGGRANRDGRSRDVFELFIGPAGITVQVARSPAGQLSVALRSAGAANDGIIPRGVGTLECDHVRR